MRRLILIAALAAGCGNLEDDRICLNGPCRVPGQPSPECAAYVACFERTGGVKGALDSTYGSGGTCWSSNNLAVEDACTSACRQALPAQRSAFPDAGC